MLPSCFCVAVGQSRLQLYVSIRSNRLHVVDQVANWHDHVLWHLHHDVIIFGVRSGDIWPADAASACANHVVGSTVQKSGSFTATELTWIGGAGCWGSLLARAMANSWFMGCCTTFSNSSCCSGVMVARLGGLAYRSTGGVRNVGTCQTTVCNMCLRLWRVCAWAFCGCGERKKKSPKENIFLNKIRLNVRQLCLVR